MLLWHASCHNAFRQAWQGRTQRRASAAYLSRVLSKIVLVVCDASDKSSRLLISLQQFLQSEHRLSHMLGHLVS